jgi:hypothetical protein
MVSGDGLTSIYDPFLFTLIYNSSDIWSVRSCQKHLDYAFLDHPTSVLPSKRLKGGMTREKALKAACIVQEPLIRQNASSQGATPHSARVLQCCPQALLTRSYAGRILCTSMPISLRILLVLLLWHRHRSAARNKCSNPKDNSQHAAHHEELEQRTASSRVIQIVQCPFDPPSSLVPRAVQLLVPHLMTILVKMRHIVVHALRETTRPRARGRRRMIVRPVWSAGRVLRTLLAVLAIASLSIERRRRTFELCASLA